MPDENKRNLQYFESASMRGLYDVMEDWQLKNRKRLLSLDIERDGDKVCCIALTNPTEVTIVNGEDLGTAGVSFGRLNVSVEDAAYVKH